MPLKKSTLVSVLLALIFCLTLPLAASAGMVKKVDNFILFLDQSGSMTHQSLAAVGQNKLDLAKATINRLDQVIPELGYTGSGAVFAPYKVIAEPAVYKTGSLGPAFTAAAPGFNQWTTLGDGLSDIGPLVGGLSGKTALILFTDGDANAGADAVASAQALYAANADKLCIHIVSYADTANGEEIIAAIRTLSGCSVAADAAGLTEDAALAQFAKDVLYGEAAPAVVKKPVVKKPAPAIKKEVITFNLLFDFDKADIKDDMIPMLEQAKIILEEKSGSAFTVAGHTDAAGPEAYNQGLSERRASAIKAWLVENGVAADRLSAKGYGETQPKYDNTTDEGRRLNRRVELISTPVAM